MKKSIGNQNLSQTDPLDVIFGAFSLGNRRVPYMSAIISADRCRRDLSLASEDPDFTLEAGRVEELFQRDLDLDRVEEMATKFLSPVNSASLPFFNSLTVALMVHGPGKDIPPSRAAQDSYPTSNLYGPVRVSWGDPDKPGDGSPQLPDNGSFGLLYWNRDGVKAVAIDGQHRLAAIRRAVELFPKQAENICVSVLFLLLDPKFGLAPAETQTVLMRKLFIDLNKHAQKVSRARQLLLDDRDPLAMAIVNSIGSDLTFRPTAETHHCLPVGERGEFVSRLPLDLVDWHGEQRAKVDKGPYAVSVLGLEWCYKMLCNSRRFGKRFVDVSKLQANVLVKPDEDYFTRVRRLVQPWEDSVPGLSDELKAAESADSLFMPSAPRLAEMGRCISSFWSGAIVALFTQAGPYNALAQYRVEHGLLSSQFGTWVQAYQAVAAGGSSPAVTLKSKLGRIESALDAAEAGSTRRFREHCDYINDSIKHVKVSGVAPEPHLLFSLTGQRAMVVALSELAEATRGAERSAALLASEQGVVKPSSEASEVRMCAELLAEAITWWDSVESKMMFTKACHCPLIPKIEIPNHFWHASIIKRDAIAEIDYSGNAAIRAGRTVFLLCAARLLKKGQPNQGQEVFKDIKEWLDSKRMPTHGVLNDSCSGLVLKVALHQYLGIDVLGAKSNEANKYPLAFASRGVAAGKGGMSYDLFKQLAMSRVEWIWQRAADSC